eukprot:11442304-Heterocapsa_arctica.AAC.2
MFTVLEVVEENIMRGPINVLRRRNGLFSHSFIHDAILVANYLPSQEVTEAIVQTSIELNLKLVKTNVKDLEEERQAAKNENELAAFNRRSSKNQSAEVAYSFNIAKNIALAKIKNNNRHLQIFIQLLELRKAGTIQ